MRSFLKWEVRDSNLGPVKLDTVQSTACYRCDISLKGAVLLAGAMTRDRPPTIRYTLRRTTAIEIKDLIDTIKSFFEWSDIWRNFYSNILF